MNFFEMMKQEEKASKKKNKKQEEQDQKEENVTEAKPVAQKQEEKSNKTKSKKTNDAKITADGFVYPFSLYTEGRVVDVSNYGFEDGKRYTGEQISKIMLSHRHYEFAGEMTYKMFEDDNMLVATARQYKKG